LTTALTGLVSACTESKSSTDDRRTREIIEGLAVLEPGDEVLDRNNNLLWKRCSLGEAWNGAACSGVAQDVSLEEARKQTPNGWRIPSIRELATLVSCAPDEKSNGIDLGDGQPPLKTKCLEIETLPVQKAFLTEVTDLSDGAGYWSDTVDHSNESYNYIIYFRHAQINGLPNQENDSKIKVRYVRTP
jgi:uncharacterized protein (TIGR02145 family)